jgi:hypothetical protein
MITMKSLITEGRYDALVTKLSRTLLSVVKDSFAATKDPNGEFAGKKIYFTDVNTAPEIVSDQIEEIYFEEVSNETIPLEFYLSLKVQWIDGLNNFSYGGDAYNSTKRDSAEPPLIEVRFEIDPAEYPGILSEVAMQLRDVLRHEIEHITQSGWNTIDSKYIASDMALRKKIESGQVPPFKYFMLPKEIPAMIHGLYLKAKKTRTPFREAVTTFLQGFVESGAITDAEMQKVLATWKSYLPKLAIRQEL